MADRLTQYLYRPGWRLRCIDPPVAWLRVTDDQPPVAAVRLQLTCFLTSRWASDVMVKDTQLAVRVGDRRFIVPSSRVTDADGVPLPAGGYSVAGNAPCHAIVDYETDAPDLVDVLREAGPPLPVAVEALLNTAFGFRRIATLDLARSTGVASGTGWQRVGTGRELDR